jgi:hypothetical protein
LKGGAFQLQALLEEFRLERGFISMKGGAFQLKALLEEFRLERGFISSLTPVGVLPKAKLRFAL